MEVSINQKSRTPEDFDFSLASLKIKKSIQEWASLGVKHADGKKNARSLFSPPEASLILPMGHKGPAFLVYRNFHAILRWNRSILYALSVGHLSDRLNGQPMLIAESADEPSLSRDDVFAIQTTLNELGFNAGEPDGFSGMLFLIFKLANEKSKSSGTVTSRPQSSPLCQPIRFRKLALE
jgi:membrane-bound lytic murein transglycosylase B